MVLRFNETVGTSGNDLFFGTTNSISFGLQGDDQFVAVTGNEFTVFAGGSGNDTYFVQVADTAITILDSGGASDMVVANGIGFSFDTTFAATIDDRHLLVFDTFSGQQILILDWQTPGNEIEWVQLADGLFSFDFVVANIFTAPNFLGDLTWEEAGLLDGLTAAEMNEAIAFYSLVEADLETIGLPVIIGSIGNDTIVGTTLLDDFIDAGPGDDTILAGAGNNFLIGGAGADNIDGGAGIDTVSYENSNVAVVINLLAGTAAGGHATGDQLTSIENIIGSNFNDTLSGDAGSNLIFGALGDDNIFGGAGADSLDGEGGNDTLEGGAGADIIDGGAGIDTASYANSSLGVNVNLAVGGNTGGEAQGDVLTNIENLIGSAFADTLTGDAGDNIIEGGAGVDVLDGGAGIDTVSYADSNAGVTIDLTTGVVSGGDAQGDSLSNFENIIGSAFGDSLNGDDGSNRIEGGAGVDTLWGKGGDDILIGGDGIDKLLAAAGSGGGDGNNQLFGGAGIDFLVSGDGADLLDGGAGSDWASWGHSTSAVNVNLGTNTLSGGYAAGDTLVSIENLTGSAFNDTLTGDSGINRLNGGLGDDTLDGGDGDDLLEGGLGADILIGGAGTDTAAYFNELTFAIIVDLSLGTGLGGQAEGDTFFGIENITATPLDDILIGDSAANNLRGSGGNDQLFGGGGNDWLFGGNGDDFLSGGDGDDVLNDDSGNNIFIGGAGADSMRAGTGIDTVSYEGSSAGVTVRLWEGTGSGGDAEGDTFFNFENLKGSDFDDILEGDTGANGLDGESGDDTLNGLQGADTLDGGAGNDMLDGGSGNDNLFGGDGNDTLEGGVGADSLDGGTGIDTASYSESAAAVTVKLWNGTGTGGDAEGDTLTAIENLVGSAFNDTLVGDSGDNAFEGGDGDDRLFASGGDDVLEGGAGGDRLDGGAGIDTASYRGSAAAVTVKLWNGTGTGGDAVGDSYISIENLIGSAFNDTLVGDNGENAFEGGGGNDRLFGSGGDDVLEGGAGGDRLDGGAGSDTASYESSSAGVTVKLWNGTGTGGDAVGDSYISIENLVGSAFNDTLVGDSGENAFEGGGGNDRLFASGGDDTLEGGAGADRLDGGSGNDTASYQGSAAAVTVKLWNGTGTGGDAEGDTLFGIENLVGSDFADTLVGDNGGNELKGGGGNDRLFASGGNDTLEGGTGADKLDGGAGSDAASYAGSLAGVTVSLAAGTGAGGDAAGDTFVSIENLIGSDFADSLTGDGANNVLEGGAGADVLDGGAGRDTASYAGSSAGVTVKLWNGSGAGGDAAGDSLTGIENLVGSDFNDTLVGDNAKNQLQGGDGNDRLFSGDGNDTLEGGAGADRLVGGGGVDTAAYAGSSSAVTVKLWNGTGTDGDAEGDTLLEIENITGSRHNDTLSGDGGVNRLEGGAGNDRLFGGGGDDILRGGSGNDRLFGQAGADTFVFDGNWGDDSIGDFEDGLDLLDFSGSALTFGDLTISQSGSDTLVEDAFGNSITLTGITATDITADDFLF